MSRIVSDIKGQVTGRADVRRSRPRRLSWRAALGLWALLSLLGWVAIYYGVPLLF